MKKTITGLMVILLMVSFLLSACGGNNPDTNTTGPVTTSSIPDTTAEVEKPAWLTEDSWIISGDSLTAPEGVESEAWSAIYSLGDSWRIAVTMDLVSEGVARILLGAGSGDAEFSVAASLDSKRVELRVDTPRGENWKTVNSMMKRIDPDLPVVLTLTHLADSARLNVVLSQEGEPVMELISLDISQRQYLKAVSVGLGSDGSAIRFSDFAVSVPEKTETPVDQLLNTMSPEEDGFYLALAKIAVEDIVDNFWLGEAPEGQIIPTWNGYPGNNLPDNRGGLWEAVLL